MPSGKIIPDPKQFVCRSIWFHGIWGLSQVVGWRCLVLGGWWWVVGGGTMIQLVVCFLWPPLASLGPCGPASGHSGREQVGDKWKRHKIQSVVGDNWDLCAIMRIRALRASRMYLETRGDKWETSVMRAENPERSGRQLEDKWETSAKSRSTQSQKLEPFESKKKAHRPNIGPHQWDCTSKQRVDLDNAMQVFTWFGHKTKEGHLSQLGLTFGFIHKGHLWNELRQKLHVVHLSKIWKKIQCWKPLICHSRTNSRTTCC